jgi:rRNA maturation RNase YbeY
MMNTKPAIYFFQEDVAFTLKGKQKIRSWVVDCIARESKTAGEINFIFCSDDYLHKMNVAYLEHDTLTDIITFDMSEDEENVTGDVFISYERAKENARKFSVRARDEIHRLIIHGVLHLLGYADKESGDKFLMTSKEDYYLSLRPEF